MDYRNRAGVPELPAGGPLAELLEEEAVNRRSYEKARLTHVFRRVRLFCPPAVQVDAAESKQGLRLDACATALFVPVLVPQELVARA